MGDAKRGKLIRANRVRTAAKRPPAVDLVNWQSIGEALRGRPASDFDGARRADRGSAWTSPDLLRWVALGFAALIALIFIGAQRQTADVRYGEMPDSPAPIEGSAGELSGAQIPSVEAMTAMLKADRVVRLPGSVAVWDTKRVAAAIGDADVRILVAPPGLNEVQRKQVNKVENATITVVGTRASGGMYVSSADRIAEWRGQFARDDVTVGLVALIRVAVHDLDDGSDGGPDSAGVWRAPTPAELAKVTADLKTTGKHTAAGATLKDVPIKAAEQAFGTDDALFVALPTQRLDQPAPDYGPALTKLFPDTPLVVMYGGWIEYHGPHAAEFADLAGAGFYARYGERLSRFTYPQDNVLRLYLGRVANIRYSGLFDRSLPYQPVDPLRVAVPVLPWLFAGCVAGFVALSARSLLRPATANRLTPAFGTGLPARLAALTALAVEVSAIAGARDDPALARAIGKLEAARDALDKELADNLVRNLLNGAHRELDQVGRALPFAGYRPDDYLRGRLA